MIEFLSWWFVVQILGLAALPVAWRLFRHLPDRGLAFARPLGLLLTSFSLWLLVSFGFLRNERVTITVLVLVLAAVAWLSVDRRTLLAWLRERRQGVLATELLFFVAFAVWTFFRSHNPEIAGTEKPMELLFLNSILRTPTFPPPDPWLSGFAISYYYFGYLMVGVLAKLTATPGPVAFNLAIPLLFAWTCTGAFSLVYNLVKFKSSNSESRSLGFGLLGPLFVAVAGNLEGFFEVLHARGIGSPLFWQWLDIKDLNVPAVATGGWLPDRYLWWWRGSRVIHDVILGQDSEVIDEFPFFSFMLGDLHPHVLALPFVLMALALALNVLRGTMQPAGGDSAPALATSRPIRRLLLGRFAFRLPAVDLGLSKLELVLIPLLLGALGFLNSWDFPTYALIFLGAYAIRRRLEIGAFNRDWWSAVVVAGLVVLGLGVILYLPFYVGFQSQAGGIRPEFLVKTRLQQYLVMLGLFAWVAIGFMLWQVRSWARTAGRAELLNTETWTVGSAVLPFLVVSVVLRWWTAALLFVAVGLAILLILQKIRLASPAPAKGESEVAQPAAPVISPNPTLATLFVLMLVAVGFALTLATEFVYIKDLFNSRMNTVFKLYYQAWTILAIAAAYGVYWLAGRGREAQEHEEIGEEMEAGSSSTPSPRASAGRYAWAAVTVVLVAVSLIYTVGAFWTKANGFQGKATLDGLDFFKQARPADYDAIQWLNTNVTSSEALGDSYVSFPAGGGGIEGGDLPSPASRGGAGGGSLPVVLQATGGSYSEAGWIAAATGLPTLLGWDFHEQQWRGNFDEPVKRQPAIQQIYTSTDVQLVRRLVDDWNVDYVYVGPIERSQYKLNQTQVDKFGRFMDTVYDRSGVVIYRRR